MSDHTPRDPAKLQRQKRLEAQLRENLRRRKGQAKARAEPEPAAGAAEPEAEQDDPGAKA